MKLLLALVCALLVSVAMVACSKTDPVVGEWSGTLPSASGVEQVKSSKLSILADGTFNVSMASGTSFSGTWERTDDGLKAKATTRNGKPVPSPEAMTLDLQLMDGGQTLKSGDNPMEWKR